MARNVVKNKKNKIILRIIGICMFLFLFNAITFPIYTFYGPFTKVRNMLVGLSMATGNHQYIAKLFFSNEEIQKILKANNNKLNDSNGEENTDTKLAEGQVDIKYTDSNIERIDISNNKFDGIALIVKDPSKVKVGHAENLGEVGQTVSQMAKRYNASAAINGGGYSDVSPNGKTGGVGGIPLGIIISDGTVVFPTKKKDYSKGETCVFYMDSSNEAHVGPASVNELLKKDVKQAISFDPSLVVNGKPYISESSLTGLNPRTAIGQRRDKSIILLAIDGRRGLKLGADLKDVQKVMMDLGAVNAMCLDGGGSTAMYYEGEIINHPSNVTGERFIPDIIYVEP